jgi:hypothetical protein
MNARVTYVQASAEKIEQGLALWRENVLPRTMAREGFLGVISLINRETGKCISLTLWDVEKHLLNSTEAEYHRQAVQRYAEYFNGAHDPENYEISFVGGPMFRSEAMSPNAAGSWLAPTT